MSRGEFLTRVTVWIAIAGYAVGAAALALSRRRRAWDAFAKWSWTIACASMLAHVACAFHFFHDWSHDSAYRETARQTAEVFKLNWGGGLYINYALVTGWALIVIFWWARGRALYSSLPRSLITGWQLFLLFIFFNAMVVFKTGLLRWLGLLMSAGLCLVWWLTAERHASREAGKKSLTAING